MVEIEVVGFIKVVGENVGVIKVVGLEVVGVIKLVGGECRGH